MGGRVAAALASLRLREQPSRLAYLLGSLAIAVVAWLTLSALAAAFSPQARAALGHVSVVAERNAQRMPMSYVERIRRMEGVDGVGYMNILALMCQPPRTVASINAWSMPDNRPPLPRQEIPKAMLDAWRATPDGLLLGADMAHACQWDTGMVIEPMDVLLGKPVTVRVSGVLPPGDDAMGGRIAFAHYEYANRQYPHEDQNQIITMRVYGTDPGRLPELANRIDAEFAHDTIAVTASTSSEAEDGLARFGNVRGLLWLVTAAMGACALLVFVSTLAHVVAERRASMASLQAMGFRRSHLVGGFVLEVLMIVVAGTLIGIAVGYAVLNVITPAVQTYLGRPSIPISAWLWLPAGVLLLVAASAIAPLRTIAHVHPRDRDGL
ncbi:MAG: FtsX-like permease family protein [Pseudomonadota bacterium]|nr:FtsX-like permease family protein [Pseudomonadota bacterium]